WVVLAAMVGLCLSLGTMLNFTFGVFAKPLAEEFASKRGSISLAIALMNIGVTLASPIAGRLVDRLGGRRLIVASILTLAVCLVGLSLMKPPLWHLYALYALAGIVGAGTSPVAYSRVVANWFDRRRGFALGVASTGVGLGVFIMPSLAQLVI